jgi:hypothetical protein
VQEVMLRAISAEIHWFQAADILGWSPRTVRRWRERNRCRPRKTRRLELLPELRVRMACCICSLTRMRERC